MKSMNYKEFENKVKSMTAHDIIMAMVDGLRNPRTKIDMDTFGKMEDGICYGCAATNAILSIMDANTAEEVVAHVLNTAYMCYRSDFRYQFENAIDHLRRGSVILYNQYAVQYGFAQI